MRFSLKETVRNFEEKSVYRELMSYTVIGSK
jgi:hypothetical protein